MHRDYPRAALGLGLLWVSPAMLPAGVRQRLRDADCASGQVEAIPVEGVALFWPQSLQ